MSWEYLIRGSAAAFALLWVASNLSRRLSHNVTSEGIQMLLDQNDQAMSQTSNDPKNTIDPVTDASLSSRKKDAEPVRHFSEGRQSRKKRIDIVTNGKGGVGKSTVAALWTQFLRQGGPAYAFDLDPVQNTLQKFKALDAEAIDATDGELANTPVLDDFLDRLCEADAPCVLDVGAGAFVSVNSWILREDVIGILQSAGKHVTFHVVVAGGKELVDTTLGLKDMIDQMHDLGAEFVVWLNPHSGPLASDGISFLESAFYNEYCDRISAVITLPALDQNYELPDFAGMLRDSRTFAEVAASNEKRAVKARLARIWRRIESQLSALSS